MSTGKPALFLKTFQRVGPWGTINQVFKRFPLLHPLVWFLVPPSVVVTVPTLLRINRQEVRARIERRDKLTHPDYIQHLFPRKADEEMPTEDWFLAQANVLIVAGFDPITNLLSATVYYLCMWPEKRKRLAAEIRGAFSSYDEITAEPLQSMRYLQAVIDEGLRIHTNAAFGLPRVSPGAVVDGHYVPKGVSLSPFPPLFVPLLNIKNPGRRSNLPFRNDPRRALLPASPRIPSGALPTPISPAVRREAQPDGQEGICAVLHWPARVSWHQFGAHAGTHLPGKVGVAVRHGAQQAG